MNQLVLIGPSQGEIIEFRKEEHDMGLVLLVILVLLLIGAVPAWPYSRGWGYWPSGGIGTILLILLILLLLGYV